MDHALYDPSIRLFAGKENSCFMILLSIVGVPVIKPTIGEYSRNSFLGPYSGRFVPTPMEGFLSKYVRIWL
jgi:hypothetical protein